MWINNGQESKKNKSDSEIRTNNIGQNVEIRVKLVKVTDSTKVELVKNYSINI